MTASFSFFNLLILSIITTLISCSSSDNDNTPLSSDTIIGEWQLIRQYGDTANECEKQSTISFKTDLNENDIINLKSEIKKWLSEKVNVFSLYKHEY